MNWMVQERGTRYMKVVGNHIDGHSSQECSACAGFVAGITRS